mgnify:CR=1 FL=1
MKDAETKLKYWFEKFEMSGWWNKKIEELSKGMQQKVQFIVTIIHNPELIISWGKSDFDMLKKECASAQAPFPLTENLYQDFKKTEPELFEIVDKIRKTE